MMVINRFVEELEPPVCDEGWWNSLLSEEEGRPAPLAARPPRVEERGKRPADKSPVDWEQAQSLFRQDQIVALSVADFNRGGLLVEGEGLQGFVPCSHLVEMPAPVDDKGREACLSGYVGRQLRLKVIECIPEEGRIVFSERAARTEAGKRTALFSALHSGQHICGEVTNVTDFGAFVDLGGVEGLIHISELSWGRVSHPRQVVRVGQRVEVLVQEVAPDRCRVALSLKRLCPNPWQTAAARYPVNQVFPAVITTLAPFGAFARLEEGLEGLIHTSEMPTSPGAAPKTSLAPGQGVQVRILQVEAARQRLSLSLKMEEDHESISLRRGEDGFQAVLSPLQRASQSQPVGSPTGGAGCAATQAVPVEAG